MATLRNKRKLAAVTRETQKEYPRNGQSRNTSVPRSNEEYITQVSEEIEARVSKKLSQEFSRTESRILGALTKLDEFLSNQQIHTPYSHIKTILLLNSLTQIRIIFNIGSNFTELGEEQIYVDSLNINFPLFEWISIAHLYLSSITDKNWEFLFH